ncbi:PD-(D/E)XK nuclease family protein [Thermophilibacter provencensis]|uniref:PD-(D/E)XK nuclease family protein n=1 Tax=Thermophilibacter provencensis TaxID=1852386 RepID=A0ABT7V5A3_9ACTN|nr:PD-(D/E)XK nuclease family protein [Thermophilibacter provencensis]MDM8271778.1 PD-(D/E)XK nuclease family protein [Thermophilibacter provencensis]
MSLDLMTTTDERLVCPEVAARLRAGLGGCGRAVLLVPSFAQALDAQRALAAEGPSVGVTVTTPLAWAQERWEVWGDGRRFVDATSRDVLARRVLSRAAWRPGARLSVTPGTVALLADMMRVGLPWLLGATVPEGVTEAERELVSLAAPYAEELRAHGLVEPCEAMAALPGLLDAEGVEMPPVTCAGFTKMSRAEQELVCGLAATHDVCCVVRDAGDPASALARSLRSQLLDRAARKGVEPRSVTGTAAEPPTPDDRAPELTALLGALFCADSGVVAPTGAVSLLLPAGPSAEPELVCEEVIALAKRGAREVVVVAPDPAAAWRELSRRLPPRGASVRAQLPVPFAELECARAYLELIQAVARLSDLAERWPADEAVPDAPRAGTVRVKLADMSWWPPRELSDFLLSRVSHLDGAQARRLDATWRGNRLLTPAAVLEQLRSTKDVSPEVATAVRELLRGRLGSAASKLFAPYVQGEDADAPEAVEAVAALSAALDVAKSLKELGLTADPAQERSIALSELVRIAVDAFARTRVALRLQTGSPEGGPLVRIVSPRVASQMAPRSTDAVLMLGQSSTESPVGTADEVRSALLAAFGVEGPERTMDAARAEFSSIVRVPREELVLERTLFGADGKVRYPSVMLSELLACYGLEADCSFEDLLATFGEKGVRSRTETALSENASSLGSRAAWRGSDDPAPAGRIDAAERACVSPPPEGVLAEDSLPLLSASQIESYLECPYKWFSLRRLRLRDADAGFTGAEMGTFAHRVLEVTRRELLARAAERALGTHELEDMRSARCDAMQQAAYRERVDALAAWAQERPEARLAGSSVAEAAALEEARLVLEEEFDAHLSHQYQLERGRRPLPQALVPHSAQQMGQLRGLRRDLSTLLDFESEMLTGFEPRFFEWAFGRGGEEVTYAGVRLTGTVDRIDVDAHGQAVVIDYKHKSDIGFAGEYDVIPKEGFAPDAPVVPRRVQSLIYAQVVRRAFPQLTVRGAVYLCTKGAHALAGAVDENLVDNVFGFRMPSSSRLARVSVPREEAFGRADERGMEALLDACEEAIAGRIERMLAGDIEAAPLDADACLFCPVLNCERRIRK